MILSSTIQELLIQSSSKQNNLYPKEAYSVGKVNVI